MKLKNLIKSKKGLVVEYAIFVGLLLFSLSMLIFTSWSRSQVRDHYYNSHISKPLIFEKAGQEFYKMCVYYNNLDQDEKAESIYLIEDFEYAIVDYKCYSTVTKDTGDEDIYTYKISVCTDESENTWLLTLEVKVNIVEEKIVKWYFVNPLYESDLYINDVKGGDE